MTKQSVPVLVKTESFVFPKSVSLLKSDGPSTLSRAGPAFMNVYGKSFQVHSSAAFQNRLAIKVEARSSRVGVVLVSVGGYLLEWHVRSWKNDPTSNKHLNQTYH